MIKNSYIGNMGCGCKSSEKNEIIKNQVKGSFIGSTAGMILIATLLSPFLLVGSFYYFTRFLITGKGFDNRLMNDYLIKKLNKPRDVEID